MDQEEEKEFGLDGAADAAGVPPAGRASLYWGTGAAASTNSLWGDGQEAEDEEEEEEAEYGGGEEQQTQPWTRRSAHKSAAPSPRQQRSASSSAATPQLRHGSASRSDGGGGAPSTQPPSDRQPTGSHHRRGSDARGWDRVRESSIRAPSPSRAGSNVGPPRSQALTDVVDQLTHSMGSTTALVKARSPRSASGSPLFPQDAFSTIFL